MPKNKAKAKKTLVAAQPYNCFWACSGKILKNLKELKDALQTMDKKTFEHHVNKTKNDFAKWINDVLMDAELSKKLAKIKTVKKTFKEIEYHLKKYYTA